MSIDQCKYHNLNSKYIHHPQRPQRFPDKDLLKQSPMSIVSIYDSGLFQNFSCYILDSSFPGFPKFYSKYAFFHMFSICESHLHYDLY